MGFLRRGQHPTPVPGPTPRAANTPEGVFVPMPVVRDELAGAYGSEGPSHLDASARRAPRANDPYAPKRAPQPLITTFETSRLAPMDAPEPVHRDAPARERSVPPPGSAT